MLHLLGALGLTNGIVQEPEESPQLIPAALLALVLLLTLALAVGRALDHLQITWLGDAGAALLVGMLGGLLVVVLPFLDEAFAGLIQFKSTIFFYFLLPPIMFDAGYSMDFSSFLKNIGPILSFALLGTIISMLLIALHMWIAGMLGLCTQLTLLQSMLFGSIVSATDPVAVLAVFRKLHVHDTLYINVFGESAINDAVGMVLYETIAEFLKPGMVIGAASIFKGIGMFCFTFVGSTVVGVAVGAGASLLFKSQAFRQDHTTLEASLVIMFAFGSYLVGMALGLSGIISCMFCAMAMSRYTRPNLSVTARLQVATFSEVLAACCELFVFVYMGSIVFHMPWLPSSLAFSVVSLFALTHSRAANIFPIAAFWNLNRPKRLRITGAQQFLMWWSGLRGGMAFALSLEAAMHFGDVGRLMMTATFVQSLVTVIFNGGGAALLIDKLKLRADDSAAEGSLAANSVDSMLSQVSQATSDELLGLLDPAALDASPHPVEHLASPNYAIRKWDSAKRRSARRSYLRIASVHDAFMDFDQRALARFFIHRDSSMLRRHDIISGSPRGSAKDVEVMDSPRSDSALPQNHEFLTHQHPTWQAQGEGGEGEGQPSPSQPGSAKP